MFQTFEASTSPEQGPPRLKALRQVMADEGVAAFIVPLSDAYQGEYVAPCDARLAWLTGFTGSAGFCAVLADEAGVFIDGRYRVQVKDQVDLDHFTPVHWPETKLGPWLKDRLSEKDVVAYDPWLHTAAEIEALRKSGLTLKPVSNLIDRIWDDRPAPPKGRVEFYPIELSGEKSGAKRARISAILEKEKQRAALITLPDSICWLLNIRGSDIERNPVVHCMAILHDSGKVDLFIDPAKLEGLPPRPRH